MARRAQPADEEAQKRIAVMAARETVQQIFQTLGVDISTPAAVMEAQEMFLGMRGLQREIKAFRTRFWSSIAALAATAIGGALLHFSRSATPPL